MEGQCKFQGVGVGVGVGVATTKVLRKSMELDWDFRRGWVGLGVEEVQIKKTFRGGCMNIFCNYTILDGGDNKAWHMSWKKRQHVKHACWENVTCKVWKRGVTLMHVPMWSFLDCRSLMGNQASKRSCTWKFGSCPTTNVKCFFLRTWQEILES